MNDPEQQLEIAINAIRKKYGENSLRYGDEQDAIGRISTGSLAFDYATGGGIPIGRFSRFYGGFSSCKSLTCWRIIQEAQAQGMTCAYYNIEKQYDRSLVERIGIDSKSLMIVEGTTIEETSAKMEALLGSVDLHVVDSCSNAVSIDELNADVADWQMGLAARVWGKVLRRINERISTNNTVILVDQIRESMAYGGGHRVPGGRIMEHISSMSVLFRKGKWMFYDKHGNLSVDAVSSDTLSGSAEADGIEIIVKVEKSRVGRPFKTAKMYLDLNKMTFDIDAERTQIAKHFKLVERSGAWYTLPSGERVQGINALREYISKNKDFQQKIDDMVRGNTDSTI